MLKIWIIAIISLLYSNISYANDRNTQDIDNGKVVAYIKTLGNNSTSYDLNLIREIKSYYDLVGIGNLVIQGNSRYKLEKITYNCTGKNVLTLIGRNIESPNNMEIFQISSISGKIIPALTVCNSYNYKHVNNSSEKIIAHVYKKNKKNTSYTLKLLNNIEDWNDLLAVGNLILFNGSKMKILELSLNCISSGSIFSFIAQYTRTPHSIQQFNISDIASSRSSHTIPGLSC